MKFNISIPDDEPEKPGIAGVSENDSEKGQKQVAENNQKVAENDEEKEPNEDERGDQQDAKPNAHGLNFKKEKEPKQKQTDAEQHRLIPSAARGVIQCSCGWHTIGVPSDHKSHVRNEQKNNTETEDQAPKTAHNEEQKHSKPATQAHETPTETQVTARVEGNIEDADEATNTILTEAANSPTVYKKREKRDVEVSVDTNIEDTKKARSVDQFTYSITPTDDEGEFVATVAEFPSLSWIAENRQKAKDGLVAIIEEVLTDIEQEKTSKTETTAETKTEKDAEKLNDFFDDYFDDEDTKEETGTKTKGEDSTTNVTIDIEAETEKHENDKHFNPILDDDDDDEENFDGDVSNLKTEQNEQEKTERPARQRQSKKPKVEYNETSNTVPNRPTPSTDDQTAIDSRQEQDRKNHEAWKSQVEIAEIDESDAKIGMSRKINYDVYVDKHGRESSDKKALRNEREQLEDNENKLLDKQKHVTIYDDEGKKRWTARQDTGKLSDRQLKIFQNINRKTGNEESEEMMKTVFANKAKKENMGTKEQQRLQRIMNRAIYGSEQIVAGSRKRFTEKDRDVLRFLGMFKYANAKHVARIHNVKERSMLKRLYDLQERGLVLKKDIYGASPIWYLTEGGLICSGLELPRVKEAGITYTMLPHQFVVNHVAGNLWGAGVNVLALEDFPGQHRKTENGNWAIGETLISEYEIQSGFASAKAANHKAEVYRPAIEGAMKRDFGRWRKNGSDPNLSPEMIKGNEYMWTLFPPFSLRLAYHVPDLVVSRPRNEDGTPNSIAVEIELANKQYDSYEKTMNAYKYDSDIYGKVIWVVKSRGAARKVKEAAEKIGTWDEDRVGIVPIYTEEGIFRGKKEWTI